MNIKLKKKIDVSVEVCGIKFKNPVLAAAGPPVRNGEAILECAKGGAGGIVTKTISTKAAKVPRPCMAEIKDGLINTELWSELSPKQWLKKEYKIAKKSGLPLIISLGYTADELCELAPKVLQFADALELSTHYIGKEEETIIDIVKRVKELVSVPVFVKISPNVPDIKNFARATVKGGADAIVAINSLGPCFEVDVETGIPFMGSKEGYGWLSGKAIKPLALRCVYDVARTVKVPVFGCGGIENGIDAVEHLMAGASAVQLCTAAITHGPKIFSKIVYELIDFMEKHNYHSLREIKGLSIRKQKKHKFRTMGIAPEVDEDKCIACGLCAQSCAYGAIKVGTVAKIDEDKCFGCGLCVSRCKKIGIGALSFTS